MVDFLYNNHNLFICILSKLHKTLLHLELVLIKVCKELLQNNLCSQINTPFLNSMISTNHEKRSEIQPIVEPYTPYFSSSVESLFSRYISVLL